jgi:hypothetical protein
VTPGAVRRLPAERGSQVPGPGRIPVTPVVAMRRPCRAVPPGTGAAARLDGLPSRARGCGRRRRGVHGGRPLQITDLLLQRVDLRPLARLFA